MTWINNSDPRITTDATCNTSSRIDDEVVPGVVFERRTVLQVSALTAATLLFGKGANCLGQETNPATNAAGQPVDDEITWEQFLEMCVPLAEPLYKKKSAVGQDAYLFSLAAQAVLLNDAPAGNMKQWREFDPAYEFELAHRGFPFIVIHWRMEPNAILPAHCHPGTSVCTVGLEGEALVRHFEPTGNAPKYNDENQASFLIRETKSQLITPHRVSTLSETRDNIHYFVAGPQGARGIDITTHYSGDGSFSFLKFDADKPANANKREYEALWVGSDLQTNF